MTYGQAMPGDNQFLAVNRSITMNHPRAVDVLCNNKALTKPWTCANYNLAGFRINLSKPAFEAYFASKRTNNIAMSVFSDGSANPAHIRANTKTIFERISC